VDAQRDKTKDSDALKWGWAVFSLLAVLLAFSALWVAADANSKKSSGGAAPPDATRVMLSEFAISPATISVPSGGSLAVDNTGKIEHNLTIEGTDVASAQLEAGETTVVDVGDLKDGTYTVICSVAGHREAGMVATLDIGGASGTAAGGDHSNMAGMSHEQMLAHNDESDAVMKAPTDAYVAQLTKGANTQGAGNQPLAPKVLPDGTKEFDIKASVIDWEVSPGKKVKAWAYNGQVPGPWIKVDVGDKVRLVLDNQLPQSTVVHFHGIDVPNSMDGVPDVTQPPVKPGTKFAYEFVAKGPAMGMYHSHHHAEHQVPDGLFGVFQVGDLPLPPNTGPVTKQVPMVLNDAGVIGLSLNGKSFPATAPISARAGEWVQITYFNEGLQVHPMHLHGIPQLVIAKDGFPLAQPYEADTLTVAPGERYTVLVRPTVDLLGANGGPGVWAFHCHILSHAESDKGMFGMVTTFIVEP
jgi:FtsP/CotA-like multicopper oxidase with cupredoxin domain